MPPARPVRGAGPFVFSTWSGASGLAVAILVGSLFWGLTRSHGVGDWLLLTPSRLWTGKGAFQPLSYGFIGTEPMTVIFSCLIAWSVGGALEAAWGPKRLWLFAVGCSALAGVLSSVVAFAMPGELMGFSWPGAPVLTTALWVAEGWRLGRRQTNFFGLPVSGNGFASIGIVFVVLTAVMVRWVMVIPDAFAIGFTYLYVRGWSPRLFWLRFTSWRLQRKMRRRAKHLRLVEEGRNTPRDSDRYIH